MPRSEWWFEIDVSANGTPGATPLQRVERTFLTGRILLSSNRPYEDGWAVKHYTDIACRVGIADAEARKHLSCAIAQEGSNDQLVGSTSFVLPELGNNPGNLAWFESEFNLDRDGRQCTVR